MQVENPTCLGFGASFSQGPGQPQTIRPLFHAIPRPHGSDLDHTVGPNWTAAAFPRLGPPGSTHEESGGDGDFSHDLGIVHKKLP